MCAETVVEIVEDVDDYRGFEAAVIADYDPLTAVERELVLRLASLLWRLRRASAIETVLFRIQTEILRDRRLSKTLKTLTRPHRLASTAMGRPDPAPDIQDNWIAHTALDSNADTRAVSPIRDLTHSLQRQNNLDNGAFDRLGRYESALWRQIMKTLFILQHRIRR